MRVVIIEDCSADDLAGVLRPYTDHIPDAGKMVEARPEPVKIDIPRKVDNPRAWTEEESAPIAAAESRDEALRTFYEMFPDSPRTHKAVEGRWYRLQPLPVPEPEPEPEPEPVIETPAPELEPVPVGQTRSWRAVENDVVAKCSSWPQAVEAYQEAFPESIRTPHAVEMRWYYLRKKGLLVAQDDEPVIEPIPVTEHEVIATLRTVPDPEIVPETEEEIPVDTQPETPAAELTTPCDLPVWPAAPTGAPDVENEDVVKALIDTRCSADIPSESGGTTYVRGYIRRVLADRQVLIECDRHGMCWCTLDRVTLLEDRSALQEATA